MDLHDAECTAEDVPLTVYSFGSVFLMLRRCTWELDEGIAIVSFKGLPGRMPAGTGIGFRHYPGGHDIYPHGSFGNGCKRRKGESGVLVRAPAW
jgi:hypothetical protein